MNRVAALMKNCGKPIFGMVHVRPTPGSPKFRNTDSILKIKSEAIAEAQMLIDCDVDGLIIENMHDRPYNRPKDQSPIVVSLLSIIGSEIRKTFPRVPIGVQVLTGDNQGALSVAAAADLDFIRCEGFVFGHIGDEGWIESCAASLLRFRKQIHSEHIWIMADVKKKHSSHAITADISLLDTIKSAEFFLADSVVVTGSFTGSAPDMEEIRNLKSSGGIGIPIALGSGMDLENIEEYLDLADLFIIGSHFKKGGNWVHDLDRERILKFMSKVSQLRKKL